MKENKIEYLEQRKMDINTIFLKEQNKVLTEIVL